MAGNVGLAERFKIPFAVRAPEIVSQIEQPIAARSAIQVGLEA